MKRPEKYIGNALGWNKAYKCSDIDPLLDRLEQLESASEFPSLEQFQRHTVWQGATTKEIYSYFSQFKTRTVYPKVGDMVEGETMLGNTYRGEFKCIIINNCTAITHNIRPITTPTRADVIEKARKLGLTDDEIKLLEGE